MYKDQSKYSMEFSQEIEPNISKPIMIAAMQDMGNVGKIVIDFINKNLHTRKFRTASSPFPSYVIDNGGYIDIPEEKWNYRYSENLILFGDGASQPQSKSDVHKLCQDVIEVSKKYQVKMIYTVGGFHTDRIFGKKPKTYATTTSQTLTKQLDSLNIDFTPQKSFITGFNGLILGYAKTNGFQGIGLYGELNDPTIPQYRAASSILHTLEKLTFMKFGNLNDLEIMAQQVDSELSKRKFDV